MLLDLGARLLGLSPIVREHGGVSACKAIFVVASLLGLAACDSSARSKMDAVPPERLDGESTAYESCESSASCAGELRCIESSCQSGERSRLGDYYAALGQRTIDDPEASSRAYNLAITQYEKENLSPPADLLCEQGIALAVGRSDSQLAEAAARILHKCILSVPPGSAPARAAMDALASLSEVGLDEELLTRSEAADLYMTGKAQRPDTDKLKLTVTGDPKNKRRSHAGLVEALQTQEARAQFITCWELYFAATKNEELNLGLGFSYSFILDEDDAARDRVVLILNPQSGVPAELAGAQSCAEKIAADIADAFSKSTREDTRWKSTLQLHIGS